MHFDTKNYLKSIHNHTVKHTNRWVCVSWKNLDCKHHIISNLDQQDSLWVGWRDLVFSYGAFCPA